MDGDGEGGGLKVNDQIKGCNLNMLKLEFLIKKVIPKMLYFICDSMKIEWCK